MLLSQVLLSSSKFHPRMAPSASRSISSDSRQHYRYCSSWSHHGEWQKLKDRVEWAKANNQNIDVPNKLLDRIVSTFNPDQSADKKPTIESVPESCGTKRDPGEAGLPEEPPLSSAIKAEAAVPADQVPMPADTGAKTLLTYCAQCGCKNFNLNMEFAQCSRCCAASFVDDPCKVRNWIVPSCGRWLLHLW